MWFGVREARGANGSGPKRGADGGPGCDFLEIHREPPRQSVHGVGKHHHPDDSWLPGACPVKHGARPHHQQVDIDGKNRPIS